MSITEFDSGLGTCYERHALYALLEQLARELEIRTSLEGPFDGIAGVVGLNSMALARSGIQATIVLPSADQINYAQQFFEAENCRALATFCCSDQLPADKRFDMVWNFNCLPQCADYQEVLRQMAQCSRRYILIFVPNSCNYGFWIHRLYHRLTKEPWSHGDIRIMNIHRISLDLQQLGLRAVRQLVVDAPWWPDIHTPIEQVAAAFIPFLRLQTRKPRRLDIYKYNWQNFPYFHEERRKALLAVLAAHPNFESTRNHMLKRIFAHHCGILAERT